MDRMQILLSPYTIHILHRDSLLIKEGLVNFSSIIFTK